MTSCCDEQFVNHSFVNCKFSLKDILMWPVLLNGLVINGTATPVVEPGVTFTTPAGTARQRQGATEKMFRVEATSYRANVVNSISRFRRSNQVFIVPFSQLSETYKRVHRDGGKIASITPV